MLALLILTSAGHTTLAQPVDLGPGPDVDADRLISAVPEWAIHTLIEDAKLDDVLRGQVLALFADYQEQVDQFRSRARQAQQKAGIEEFQALADELFDLDNPFTPSRKPPDDPRWPRWWELNSAIANSKRSISLQHREAVRELVASLEILIAEHDIIYPVPALIVYSSLEHPWPRNPLNPLILDLNNVFKQSLHEGVLRDLYRDRLPAMHSQMEAEQFVFELRQVLHGYSIEVAQRLATYYHRPLPTIPNEDRSPRGVTEESLRDLQRNGQRWRRHFDQNQRTVDQIAAIISEYATDEDADRWLRSYKSLVCAPIFEDRWPLKMVEWLRDQPEVANDEISMAEALRDMYKQEVKLAQDRAYRAAIAAASETGFVTVDYTASRAHRACHDALLDLHLLGRRVLVDFRRSLTPQLQDRLKAHWLAMRDPRIAGPLPVAKHLSPARREELYKTGPTCRTYIAGGSHEFFTTSEGNSMHWNQKQRQVRASLSLPIVLIFLFVAVGQQSPFPIEDPYVLDDGEIGRLPCKSHSQCTDWFLFGDTGFNCVRCDLWFNKRSFCQTNVLENEAAPMCHQNYEEDLCGQILYGRIVFDEFMQPDCGNLIETGLDCPRVECYTVPD